MQLTLRQRKVLHSCKGSCWLARIDLGDDRPIRSCVVLEMTGSGARLAAGFAADVPNTFFLLLSASGNVERVCSVQQRTDNELVVRFLRGSVRNNSQSPVGPGAVNEKVFID